MKNISLIILIISLISSCTPIENVALSVDALENAQQVGDVMASLDEASGQTNGSIASHSNSINKMYARYFPASKGEIIFNQLNPSVEAASCSLLSFTTCASGEKVRNYNGCTIGSTTLSGTTTLSWSNNTCTLTAISDTVTRVPNFTLTGRRSATLTVNKTGSYGQKLTASSVNAPNSIFLFESDGIRRKFTAGSSTLFDQTTSVSPGITVTGNNRLSRTLSGGVVRVYNNLTGVTCTYSPTNITWGLSTCNCPTSGYWSGSCSNSKQLTLEITGCGTANYTEGGETSSVTFDRCGT